MYLQRQGHFQTGQEMLDVDVRDLTVVSTATGTYLYAATGVNGGLSAYRISVDGSIAQSIDVAAFTPAMAAAAAGMAEVIEVQGQPTLIFGGVAGAGLMGMTLNANGSLGALTDISDGSMGQVGAMTMATTSGGTRIYTVDSDTGALSIHTLPDGQGQNGNGAVQNTSLTFGSDTRLETVQMGNDTFLLAMDPSGNSVTSYAVSAGTGALSQVGLMGASFGVGISVPTAMETLSAFGQTWVVLGSAGSSSLTVMQLEADGGLVPVDHIIDSLSTRFDGLTSFAVAQDGDRVFVVAGGADDGLSVFTLAPDGRLIHLDTMVHTTGGGLQNVTQLSATVSGDHIQVFAGSGTAAGLTQFNIDISALADAQVAGAGAQVLTGSWRQDMLVGSATGRDTLEGGAGDDILIAGAAGASLTGGGGADRFVLHADATLTDITDFTPGLDMLDMSDFPMLRSVAQLTVQPMAWGAQVSFRGATINVFSASGTPLDTQDIFGAGFIGADRVLVLLPGLGDVVTGTDNNDTLTGTDNNDTLSGGAGHDTLQAGSGNDLVQGGDGHDLIEGGEGEDTLNGEAGRDEIWGGGGNDEIDGGQSHDLIFGGGGDDTLMGGSGNDQVWGGAGDDLVEGAAGDDTLGGAAGNDTIYGGTGDDEAWASAGNDLLYGGKDNDLLGGGSDNDTLWGEDGNDTLWGGRGNDAVHGGNGHDVVGGGPGKDMLWGDAGNDTFWANGNNDTLWGGAGDDLMGAGENDDLVYGEEGHDELRLGLGNDTGDGGSGNDTLIGAGGSDLLFGGSGDDVLQGDYGDDTLSGDDGNDVLLGGYGKDVLQGGAGNDVIWSGGGNDTIAGGQGDDVLVGEGGADVFIFYANQGNDVVRDFTLGEDIIHIGSGAQDFQSLSISQQGGDAVITLGTSTIRLKDVTPDALDAGDFLFL